jgi:hypothetical protein
MLDPYGGRRCDDGNSRGGVGGGFGGNLNALGYAAGGGMATGLVEGSGDGGLEFEKASAEVNGFGGGVDGSSGLAGSKAGSYQYPKICYNCGEEHLLYRCNRAPDDEGFMRGCQKCGKGSHWYDSCTRPDEGANDEHWYNIEVRHGLPPFRQSWDMRLVPGFHLIQSRPMTPAFAANLRSEGYFDQFKGQPISHDQVYVEDLSERRGGVGGTTTY